MFGAKGVGRGARSEIVQHETQAARKKMAIEVAYLLAGEGKTTVRDAMQIIALRHLHHGSTIKIAWKKHGLWARLEVAKGTASNPVK